MTPSVPPIGAFLWLMVVLFSLMLYVVLDGYDLGVGVLLLFARQDEHRKEMIELIATSWDGNESWLVLVGIGLFAGFPLAYSTLLPAIYVPVILMLLALIVRGVSFEFQSQAQGYPRGWGLAFAVGSLIAAFCQGVIFDQCAASGALGVRVSWLGQRPYLFPGTLAENIALGRPEASRQEIEVAASQAHVMEFAAALPDGLNTQIGERGLGLSGGQAQRVALARAFLKNAPLLLLDEPTAHLDAETEAVLIATIVELARDKTVVLATHSPVPLALCDHVLELDDGTLRHSQVVQREEVFYA